MLTETENQTYLRRSKAAFEAAKIAETEARKVLAQAVELTKKSKEKYEQYFFAEEKAEVVRRKSTYNHCTA